MAAVSEQVVREYFETLGFLVAQPRKFVASRQRRRAEEEVDLLVANPLARSHTAAPAMLWTGTELQKVQRAVVGVLGWHTDRLYAATLQKTPEVLAFASTDTIKAARAHLGPGPVAKIICVPRLPASKQLADDALGALKQHGIDGVLTFTEMLSTLIGSTNVRVNYEKSDLMQTLRLLKCYDLLREPQMELFEPKKRKRR